MNFLVLGKPDDKYTINRLTEEAKNLDHSIVFIRPSDLSITVNNKGINYDFAKTKLEHYDLIYMLILGRISWPWFYLLQKITAESSVKVVNEKFIDSNYKLFYTSVADFGREVENKIPFPKSTVFFKVKTINDFIGQYKFPLILKISAPKLNQKGKGVHLINNVKDLESIVDAHKNIANCFTIREYIPNDGDIRVFTVGYKAIGAMFRTPKEGDFRSNISQGGTGKIFDLADNPKVKELAEKASAVHRTEIAGVDIMLHKQTGDPYLLEVNRSPQIVGLETYTKVNAANEIIRYFECKVEGREYLGSTH